jgi:hypothetical protein
MRRPSDWAIRQIVDRAPQDAVGRKPSLLLLNAAGRQRLAQLGKQPVQTRSRLFSAARTVIRGVAALNPLIDGGSGIRAITW